MKRLTVRDLRWGCNFHTVTENASNSPTVEQFIALFKSEVAQSTKMALPVGTLTWAVTHQLNGAEVFGFYLSNADTEGDTIVQFKKSNLFCMGDTFFNVW